MPNIATNHAITYTNSVTCSGIWHNTFSDSVALVFFNSLDGPCFEFKFKFLLCGLLNLPHNQ